MKHELVMRRGRKFNATCTCGWECPWSYVGEDMAQYSFDEHLLALPEDENR